jgi:glutathione synthase/RimK-type ligase-like ATP-grasp enzyme
MSQPILIASLPSDIHAYAVAEALRLKGADPIVWCVADFPTLSGESISLSGQSCSIRIDGPSWRSQGESFRTVWHRRILSAPDFQALHPGDRAFASQQCDVFRRGMLDLLCPEAFWVNPVASSQLASRKIFQHRSATRAGLAAPDTLFSNDPEEIRRFIRSKGGRVAFKTLTPASWHDDEDRYWAPYTVRLTEEDLVPDLLLRQTPAIFQELAEKDFEARVTVMGRTVFAAKIRSQETSKGRLDWRLAYDELKMEPVEAPAEVMAKCFDLMERLGIVFGCFDFIVTPHGEWVFLEVNEMGQFLFIETYTGMPLLDAFSDFLLAARADFSWEAREPAIRFRDVHESVRQGMIENIHHHVNAENRGYYEGQRAT